jgi:phospholipid transport system substrate-binding protein
MSTNETGRRAVVGLAVGAMIALGCARTGYAQSTIGPAVPIERLNEALLTVMKGGRTMPFTRRFDVVAAAVDDVFDLETILQRSVGPRWPMLLTDEQVQLRTAFRRYTIVNYVASFDGYGGETFAVAPETQAIAGGDEVVTTRIVPVTGVPTTLSYVVRRSLGGWKAIDVLVNGTISRVAVQRSDFRTLLSGGSGSALVASLRQKVMDLSGGALS